MFMFSNMIDRFNTDLVGNSLAVIVLLLMVFSLIYQGFQFYLGVPGEGKKADASKRINWLIPALCLAGMVVASYLSFVETTKIPAVCGPIGDCNSVQQSSYARLWGVLPVGIAGLAGYLAILVCWFVWRYGPPKWRTVSILGMEGMIIFGLIFSIYLTFLEPFVIGATCIWCISSAVVMMLLFWITTKPAILAWQEWSET